MNTTSLLSMGTMPFVIVIAFAVLFAIIAIVGTLCHYSSERNKRWHDTARAAIAQGQAVPLPPPPLGAGNPNPRNDLRSGLITLAVGIALYLGFREIGAYGPPMIAAYICLAVGIAMILWGGFAALRKEGKSVASNSDRSV